MDKYRKLPRHKKFNNKWYIITDINFNKKYVEMSVNTIKKIYNTNDVIIYPYIYEGNNKIEYGIYLRNP